jgi:hypothetical protein
MYIVCVKCLEKIEVENKKNYVLNDKKYYHNDCYFELKKKTNLFKSKLFSKFNYLQDQEKDELLSFQDINNFKIVHS